MHKHTLLFSLLAIFLLAGCTRGKRTIPLVNGLIDEFEDGNPINMVGNPWTPLTEGNNTRSQIAILEGGYPHGSRFYLHVEGYRSPEAQAADIAGVRTMITNLPPQADPAQHPLPRDIRMFEGLAFALRGTPGTYVVQIGTASVKDYDYFNAYVTVTEEWTEYRIPFSAFAQEGFGKQVAWTGKDVQHIAFLSTGTGPFELDIDQVGFYK